ncbi:dihydrolipoyl dehydrogenase [bacterium]|nr:dihydrolipoyl dehydrogenase [bacterium]
MTKKFDLVVIGGGPGGYTAAIRAAQLKMKVAIVEKDKLGGICLNWGCIPTKALLKSAELYHSIKKSEEFGIKCENVSFDFAKVISRSRDVSGKLSNGVKFLMKKNQITHFTGTAFLKDANTIEVSGTDGQLAETITSDKIILATGGRTKQFPNVPFDGEKIISSREAMTLPKQPKSMLIIGAGAIGVEFASFYNEFGTEITIVEMLPNILPIEDEEVSKTLEKLFEKRGINVYTNSKTNKIEKNANGISAEIETPKGIKTVNADVCLVAIGIAGNIENLGLEALGIETNRGFIKVNDSYETNVHGIFAIGDVIGQPLLAHVASAEGICAVERIAGNHHPNINYNAIPGCTYCSPQVASIGYTERKAKELGYEVKIGNFPMTALGKAKAIGETDGFVKVIFDTKYGELLGAHIIGAEATELIAEFGLAKTLEITQEEFINTIHAHPTISESILEAVEASLGKAINF